MILVGVALLIGAATIGYWVLRGVHGTDRQVAVEVQAVERAATAHEESESASNVHRSIAPAKAAHSAATRSIATPLPPPGAPLAQIYDELKARADGGDPDAAARLFTDAEHCFLARQMVHAIKRSADNFLDLDTSKLTAQELQRREEALADMQQRLAKAQEESKSCDGVREEQLLLTPLALQAAQLGDSMAADCYASGMMLYTDGVLNHPELLEQFRDSAMPIAQAAIERGDWRMVAMLGAAYSQDMRFSPLAQLTGPDPVRDYRYARLQQFGASPANAAAYARNTAAAAQGLSSDDIRAGDTWAHDTYQRYFAGHDEEGPPNTMNFCSM